MDKEENYRKAFDTLQRYMENRNNPLSGSEFVKLVDEMFKAYDNLIRSK